MTVTPVIQDGAVLGVIVTEEAIDADFPVPYTLRERLGDLVTVEAPPQAHGPITSIVQGGTIVSTCYDTAEDSILGSRLSDEALHQIRAGRVYQGAEPVGGQRYLILGRPLRNNAGTVIGALVVGLPERPFLALRDTTLKSVLAVFLLVASLALLVAASLSDVITLPVRELTREAKVIAAGNLDVQVPVAGRDEIGELGRAFNEMTAQLQDTYEALRRERRKALAAIEASVDGIWVDYTVDGERRIVMMNSALEQMTGYRRKDLINQRCTCRASKLAVDWTSPNNAGIARWTWWSGGLAASLRRHRRTIWRYTLATVFPP